MRNFIERRSAPRALKNRINAALFTWRLSEEYENAGVFKLFISVFPSIFHCHG